MEENVQNTVESAKAGAELALKKFIEVSYEPVVDGLLKELAEKIPGAIDDAIIATLAPTLKPVVKNLLLAQIEKISDKV